MRLPLPVWNYPHNCSKSQLAVPINEPHKGATCSWFLADCHEIFISSVVLLDLIVPGITIGDPTQTWASWKLQNSISFLFLGHSDDPKCCVGFPGSSNEKVNCWRECLCTLRSRPQTHFGKQRRELKPKLWKTSAKKKENLHIVNIS